MQISTKRGGIEEGIPCRNLPAPNPGRRAGSWICGALQASQGDVGDVPGHSRVLLKADSDLRVDLGAGAAALPTPAQAVPGAARALLRPGFETFKPWF